MSGKSKDGRTVSDRKYRPIRREVSRYGKIEKVLRELKEEGVISFEPTIVAKRVKIMQTSSIAAIFQFTNGITKGEKQGTYVFTEEEIRVDAG